MKRKQQAKIGLGTRPEASRYEQAQQGCETSLELLMARHEPLVKYAVQRQNLGDLPKGEAEQAGRIGLWKAILGYDPQRGYQFSTYAYPAIVHYLWRAVKEHCVANGQAHAIREWKVFFREWEVGPLQQEQEREIQACLGVMVARLPRLWQRVVIVRYELEGASWQTYEQLGRELGYSREWVRLAELQALIWLRHPAHSQELRELLKRHSLQEYEWAQELAQAWLRRRGGRHG
jgi:RNA polymerase sigma factor (sigma-70 family)